MIKIAFAIILTSFSTLVIANNSIVRINDPAGITSYYTNSAINNVETHIIGVYETRSDHGFNYHPEGTAFLHVSGSASTPINLVLSSYEPTNWVLDGEGLSFINSVIVNGFHPSRVMGVNPSIIMNKAGSFNYISACAYAWPGDNGGCDTQKLVKGVEDIYGTKITTFTGVYRATNFSVTLAPVPEPSSIYILSLGLVCLIFIRRTRGSINEL